MSAAARNGGENEEENEEVVVGWRDLCELVPDGVVGTLALFAVSSISGTVVLWLLWQTGGLQLLIPDRYSWLAEKVQFVHAFTIVAWWWVLRLRNGSPFAGSEPSAVLRMVELAVEATNATAGQHKSDGRRLVVADMGAGDGRVIHAMAAAGFQAHGYENDLLLVFLARLRSPTPTGDADGSCSKIHWQDMWQVDCSKFDVVFVYQWDLHMTRIEDKLRYTYFPSFIHLLEIPRT